MTTPANQGNELFLLMVNLSRVRDRDTVVRLFTQACSSLFEDLEFEFDAHRERSERHSLDLVTWKGHFGRIFVRGPWETTASETRALIQNAVVMLALILENLSREEELAEQKNRLELDMVLRTAELVQANEAARLETEERLRAQEALRLKTESLERSDALKQAVLDGITANVALVDENLVIQWANKAAADSVGKRPDQLVGHRCHEFWAHADKPCEGCPTVKAVKTG
ncbi:MAG: PAS domain-containing protein, partial [Pseudomonadota bacterium]